MALSFSDNISYSGTRSNFERDSYATIADMVAVKKTKMPQMLIATCVETGKVYLYNKSNEVDETLGLWREVGASGNSGNVQTYALLTQAEYDALDPKDSNVLYLIKEEA